MNVQSTMESSFVTAVLCSLLHIVRHRLTNEFFAPETGINKRKYRKNNLNRRSVAASRMTGMA
jgi:hypothetical protein